MSSDREQALVAGFALRAAEQSMSRAELEAYALAQGCVLVGDDDGSAWEPIPGQYYVVWSDAVARSVGLSAYPGGGAPELERPWDEVESPWGGREFQPGDGPVTLKGAA